MPSATRLKIAFPFHSSGSSWTIHIRVFSEMEPANETELLMELANLLREASWDCGVLARVSQYGFAVILPGVTSDGALSRADCLRDAVIAHASTTIPITASVASSGHDHP